MAEPHGSDSMRSLLAELATGAIAGDERALVLEHLALCPPCRQELVAMTRATDALLSFGPRVEPPPGFESRVLAALGAAPAPHQRRRRRQVVRLGHWLVRTFGWRRDTGDTATRPHATRLLVATAIAVAVAAGSAGGAALMQWRGQEDRVIADSYRRTLEVANGQFLAASGLTTTGGERAGTVFLYQGNPSWILVTVTDAPADGRYQMIVVDREGDHHPAGVCLVGNRVGTTGYALPVPVSSIASIRLRLAGQPDFDMRSQHFSINSVGGPGGSGGSGSSGW